MVIDNPYRQDERKWFDSGEQKLTWAAYMIGDTEIIIGNRPDIGTTNSFYKSVDAWINVSDRFVKHDHKILNTFIPWNEGGKPTYEAVYSFLMTLHYWITELKLKKIYISCDGGTNRAPSLFGIYLHVFFPNDFKRIIDAHIMFGREERIWSSPEVYSKKYISEKGNERDISYFLKHIKEKAWKLSPTYGVSLEDYMREIEKSDEFLNYHLERMINRDIRNYWFQIKLGFQYGVWNKIKKFFNLL